MTTRSDVMHSVVDTAFPIPPPLLFMVIVSESSLAFFSLCPLLKYLVFSFERWVRQKLRGALHMYTCTHKYFTELRPL